MADFIDVSGLLYPKSVAVIGASGHPGNQGGDTVQNLLRFGFPGRVWAVNTHAASVHGARGFASVAELPEVPDLAILAVADDEVANAIRACAERGTRSFVALGRALPTEVATLCRDAGFALCGPNGIGIINVATPVAASFAPVLADFDTLRAGPISMVTQSGGIGTTVFSLVQRAGFGFRHLVSSGDEAVVRFPDYLHALTQDAGTRIIAAYLEGVGDGGRLIRALEEARDRGKQVVMIKAGGAGAPLGQDHVFDAILQELGVIRVRSVEDLVDTCLLLAATPADRQPRGRGVGIVTIGGSNGVLAADQCATHGLAVPILTAPAVNPMDLTSALDDEALVRLPAAMDALAAQTDIDSLLLIVGSQGARAANIADMIAGFSRVCGKPVGLSWPSPPPGLVQHLAGAGIVAFDEPDRALRALGRLTARAATRARPRRASIAPLEFDWSVHVEARRRIVPEDRCHAILIDAGLPVAPGRLAIDAAAALPIAHEIGLPVALKPIDPKATRRAGAGLLATDLRSADEVVGQFRWLEDRARAQDITLDGIYVQKMQRGGIALMVSVFRDPIFGTMVSCGSGGPLADLIDDRVTERAPVTEAMAADMVERLRGRALARDVQGPFDVAAPAAFIARLSLLGAGAPWAAFTFEVDPLNWSRAGVAAVGSLLLIG